MLVIGVFQFVPGTICKVRLFDKSFSSPLFSRSFRIKNFFEFFERKSPPDVSIYVKGGGGYEEPFGSRTGN
jgi:hypothetical protein